MKATLESWSMEQPFGRPVRGSLSIPLEKESPLRTQTRARHKFGAIHSGRNPVVGFQMRFGGDGWFDMSIHFISRNLAAPFRQQFQAGKLPHVKGDMMKHANTDVFGNPLPKKPSR